MTSVEQVRFLYGDPTSPYILPTTSVEWALVETGGNVYAAAVICARAAAAACSALVDKSVGDLSISYSQRAKAFLELVKSLQMQASRRRVVRPYAGGISLADKETNVADTDNNQPTFVSGQFDNKAAS